MRENITDTSMIKPHDLYVQQMLETKRRFRAIDRILGAKKPLTLDMEVDNESVFLQIRKIVELITFSAIIADEQRYQRSRQLDSVLNPKDKGDYTLDWKASDILVRLSKISPYFLPRPLGKMTVQSDNVKNFDEPTAKSSHDRLIEIYKTANGFAHIPNPYKANIVELELKKKESARSLLEKDVSYLKSIIWEHAKIGLAWNSVSNPKELDQSESAWLIWFGDKGTDTVRMVLAKAI